MIARWLPRYDHITALIICKQMTAAATHFGSRRLAMQINCHLSCLTSKHDTGGAYRDRTDDPLLAKQVLSQLS